MLLLSVPLLVPALLLRLMGIRGIDVVAAIGLREETFPYATVNTSDNACLDVKARGFWCRGQDAYFNVRVLYPNASSYCSLILTSAYKCHKDNVNMVNALERLIMESLLYWYVLPLGGMGQEATAFYKRLADFLATHWGQPYSLTIHWE